ncbi:MAG: extracellular solute-binding protein [Clostridiales bacterium]|nr:extracellular solute-binding protein [Clostridiales bacterium]
MKRLLSLCLAAGLMVSAYALADEDAALSPTVVLCSQGAYIDPDVLSEFTRETGIDVEYVVAGDGDDIDPAECDLLLADVDCISLLAEAGRVQALDARRFSPWGTISPQWLELDGLEAYAAPCLWTTMGLVYDPTRTELRVTQWADLADAAFSGQILMPADTGQLTAVALAALELDVNAQSAEALAAAGLWLKGQSSLVLDYCNEEGMADWFRSEEAVLAVCPASDAIELMAELPELSFVIPSGGSWQIVLCYAVAADTDQEDAVYTLLNYLCEAENLAKNATYSGWSVTSDRAFSLLSPSWRSNPLAYPELDGRVETPLLLPRDSQVQSLALLDTLADFRRMALNATAAMVENAW